MRYLILSFTAILVGCGQGNKFTFGTFVDSEFAPYLAEFQSIKNVNVDGLSVEFTDSTNHAGTCSTINLLMKVRINRTVWASACDAQKRAIIFHELGHCLLSRPHVENLISYMYGVYASNMCDFYERNEPAMIEEMRAYGGLV